MFNFFNILRRNRFCNFRNYNNMNYTLINFETAKHMIENNEVILIDVRDKKEYESMHIINAINISVDDIVNGSVKFPKDSKIIVYCTSGARSKKAIMLLNKQGYNKIYIWEYAALTTFPYKNMLTYNKM